MYVHDHSLVVAKDCHAKVELFDTGRSPHDNVLENIDKHKGTVRPFQPLSRRDRQCIESATFA